MQRADDAHMGDRDAAALNLQRVAPVPLGVREPPSIGPTPVRPMGYAGLTP